MKFKVGDKVIGKASATKAYAITKEGWIGTVMSVNDDRFSARGKGLISDFTFERLDYKHFELVHESKIVITSNGKKTTAKLYEGDKVIKSASARCNPEDKFDFNEGAKLAFERLMGNAAEEPKYKPGDKVKVISDTCHHFNKIGAVLTLDHIDKFATDERGIAWRVKETTTYIRERDFEPCVELYNGKVVCVKAKPMYAYTVGKVYEFKDGKVEIDNGSMQPTHYSITSLDEWNKDEHLYCEFIPLVE